MRAPPELDPPVFPPLLPPEVPPLLPPEVPPLLPPEVPPLLPVPPVLPPEGLPMLPPGSPAGGAGVGITGKLGAEVLPPEPVALTVQVIALPTSPEATV